MSRIVDYLYLGKARICVVVSVAVIVLLKIILKFAIILSSEAPDFYYQIVR